MSAQLGLWDEEPPPRLKLVDTRPRTDDGRIVTARACECCGVPADDGRTTCRFCRLEDCGGACGVWYGPTPR